MPLINDPDGLSQGGLTSPADLAFTASSGADATLTGSATLPAVTAGDFIEVRDNSIPGNNGLYLTSGSPTTSAIDVTKMALSGAVVNPADNAGEANRIFGSDANEKNVFFDTGQLLFTLLNGFGSVTVLDNEGVVGQSLYSFFKEEWKADNDLIKFPFPMTAITPEQFEFNGWRPVNESESTISTGDASDTQSLIRTAGWDEVDIAGFIETQYFGWVTLGNVDVSDFVYGFFDSALLDADIVDALFDGPTNEVVQTIFRSDLSGAGVISVTGGNTLSRTTGSWLTDGYKVGDEVFIQNAEDSANNGSFPITAVVALDITAAGLTNNADDTTMIVSIDRRNDVFTPRIRVFGKTFDQSSTTDIGVTTLTNQVYRFPLSEGPDAVIVDLAALQAQSIAALLSDIVGDVTAPYDGMAVGYNDHDGITITGLQGGDGEFAVVVDQDADAGGGQGLAEDLYAFVQAQLLRTDDFNDANDDNLLTDPNGNTEIVIGRLAEPLLAIASTGNTLSTIPLTTLVGSGWAGPPDGFGVAIRNHNSNDTNRIEMTDNSGVVKAFPFVAAGDINFNSNLSEDVDAIFRMFFTNDDAGDDNGFDFGTINAITVEDNSVVEIEGAVPQQVGGSSLSFDFDFDGNVQRGAASAGDPAPITIVAIGLSTAQYVIATGTIIRAVGQNFSLVAALERNFSNP
jgi:hypothetical protein